jgi:leucyl-tRNA synthetase
MDPHNADRFVSEEAEQYWGQVDLYMGGAEHATGHLLYSRFWYLFLKDLGLVTANEPFQKLINQGMILGVSQKALRNRSAGSHVLAYMDNESVEVVGHMTQEFISADVDRPAKEADDLGDEYIKLNVPIEYAPNGAMTADGLLEFIKSSSPGMDSIFVCKNGFHEIAFLPEDGTYKYLGFVPEGEAQSSPRQMIFGSESINDGSVKPADFITVPEVEKMSKSKRNVVNPDVLIDKYGADALRLYEMFLGPLEQFKPWNTNGISGVATFLKKFWRLFHPEDGALAVTDEAASPAELKALHRVIQKVAQDIDKFSFNTSVSTFMIAVNELTALGTHKRAVLEPLVLLLSPFAPHLAEELWEELGHESGSISHAAYPEFREEYLVEANVTYPVAINGKVREQRQFAATATAAEIETAILESDFLARFGDGKTAKKVVVVPGRMVNVVV